MSKKTLYYIRKFLNKKKYHTGGHIIVDVSEEKFVGKIDKKGKREAWLHNYISLKIADCTRVIDLEFEYSNNKEYKNSIYKIDLLINTLIKFKEALKQTKKNKDEFEALYPDKKRKDWM